MPVTRSLNVAEPAHVDAEAAADIEDAAALQRCVLPDQIEPAVLAEPPHEAWIPEGDFRPVGRLDHGSFQLSHHRGEA